MHRRILAAAAFVAWAWFAPVSADASERIAVLTVENVSCVSCGPIFKRALARVAGVSSVDVVVSGTTGTATVVYDDAHTEPAALVAATVKAGFPSRLEQ